jgi:hypothetical protein
MRSTDQQLRSRGYLPDGEDNGLGAYSDSGLLKLVASDEAVVRTAAVRILSERGPLDDARARKFVELLARETKLYTRLELSSALHDGGDTTARALIPCLGLIGNNQHRVPDPTEFKKSSYPLPRDLAARILAHCDQRVLPYLLDVLLDGNRVAIAEALDAVGFLCRYGVVDPSTTASAGAAILTVFKRSGADDLVRWKAVRALQSFDDSAVRELLESVEVTDNHTSLRLEATRSLTVVRARSGRSAV